MTAPIEPPLAREGNKRLDRERVSAFIISFNEADHITACVQSLSFCDEVLVIDSFSTDNTVQLAEQAGARVIQHPWQGYSAQKAFGLSQVQYEWVINLDADERISSELREHIETVLGSTHTGEVIAGYYMNRVVFHLNRWWRRGGWYPEWRLRLFRRSLVTWGGIDPHEKPIPSGKTLKLPGEILHYSYDDLADQIKRLDRYSTISAEEAFKNGERASLGRILVSPVARIFKFYVLKRGFLEGIPGVIVALAEGYYTFLKYAKLWEREHVPPGKKKPHEIGSSSPTLGD